MKCIKLIFVVLLFIAVILIIDMMHDTTIKRVRWKEPFISDVNEIKETNNFIIDNILNNGDDLNNVHDEPKYTLQNIDDYMNNQCGFRNKIYNTSHVTDVVDRINSMHSPNTNTRLKDISNPLLGLD